MGLRCWGHGEGGPDLIVRRGARISAATGDLVDNEWMDVAKERGLRHLDELGLIEFLKVRREEVGLSQEEASRKIGLASLSHYGHFERGTRDVQIEYIRPMADMLQVPAGLILEKYFRHMYGTSEHRWIVDELYGPELAIAQKLKRLSEGEKKGIAVMVDLFLSKNP